MEKLKGGWRSRANLPLALLLVALGTLFLFGNDRGHFYRPGHHDWLSSKYLVMAENLSPKHGFTMFHRLLPGQDGNPEFEFTYHRFPIGGYALIKLAILPFGDDLSAKIHAGRMLMLMFFAAAAVLAHFALSRIAGSQWIACTATGLAFSSHFCLYYSDMIATEGAMDLFAVMLVFHGLTLFVQEGRFRQLLAKTCIALLIGWHVYALLLPFIVFSLASAVIRAHEQLGHAAPLDRTRRIAGLFFLSRPVALGAVALAFGLAVLSFNMASEWLALGGAKPIAELPTFGSMLNRMGLEPYPEFSAAYADRLTWPHFLENQLRVLGGMILPYALPGYASALQLQMSLGVHPNAPVAFEELITVGAPALAACLAGLLFARHKILLATLTLSGFCWALPMRRSVFLHDFEGLVYIGVPLTLFSLVLLYLRRLSGERLMARLAVAALLVFCFSNFQMSLVGNDADRANFQAEALSDFQAIRAATSEGDAIGVLTKELKPPNAVGVRHGLDYYLAQRAFLASHRLSGFASGRERLNALDFIVTNWREPGIATLTPQNRRFFLYDQAAYEVTPSKLLAQSNFDVYHAGSALIYFKSPCTEADTAARFLLHVFPVDPADLPEDRRRHRFDNLDFTFSRRGDHFETREATACAAEIDLPSYGIASINTGQFNDQGPIWWEEFPMPR